MHLIRFNKINWISFLITCVIFSQNPLWPIWKSGMVISFILVLIIFGYLVFLKKRKLNLTPFQWFVVLLSLFIFIGIPLMQDQIRLSSYVTVISFLIACILNKSEKIDTIKYVTVFLSVIIFISFPFWVFDVFIKPLPIYNFIDLTSMKGSPTIMGNYFFFVKYADYHFERFYSVFDEPGVLGTLSAFVLFANQYNFKRKELVIILIGSLFTYSLAFYMLTFIGYLLFFFAKKKGNAVLSFIILAAVLGMVYSLNNKDLSQNPLFYRFQNLDQQLDNRSSAGLQSFFSEYIKSSDAFFGKGLSFLSESNSFNGASYTLFLIEYGIIGAIALFLVYFSIMRHKSRVSYFLLFYFFLSFIQRPDAFAAWQILLFTCCLAFLEKNISNKTEPLHA